jgi:hypothetical protein|tara:strand:- start:89 stop:208 length:120 start_codon:yes stop_codon:yes gene_type:complete
MKRICFICGNSGYIKAGQFAGLPCPNNSKHIGYERDDEE